MFQNPIVHSKAVLHVVDTSDWEVYVYVLVSELSVLNVCVL